MPSRIYVETSIPSFFYEERPQAEMVARRAWTRTWWTAARPASELVTSVAVIDELERGEFSSKQECLELVAALPLLAIEPPILDVVEAYIRHFPGDLELQTHRKHQQVRPYPPSEHTAGLVQPGVGDPPRASRRR